MKNRLNIFIDETGEFGFGKRSARLYGVSLVFHEQKDSIAPEVRKLNEKFDFLDFHGMVHMGDLIMGHHEFSGMTIAERRKIYVTFYKFSREVQAKYHTIIIDKKNTRTSQSLNDSIEKELRALIIKNLSYIQSFDELVLYYDGGQVPLNKLLNKIFRDFTGYRQNSDFDHLEKKLFQVADMLTYVDKIIYKYNKGMKLSKTEQTFFGTKNIKTTIAQLKRHRI